MKKQSKKESITKDMTFEELITKYPKTIPFLLEKGMHCAVCHMASTETIEQGASIHGINVNKLVKELNLLVSKEAKKNG